MVAAMQKRAKTMHHKTMGEVGDGFHHHKHENNYHQRHTVKAIRLPQVEEWSPQRDTKPERTSVVLVETNPTTTRTNAGS